MISVAIATMGRPRLVARCVASVLAGELEPCAILVVDQSRDDGTRRALQGLGATIVRYLPEEACGASAARNRAVQEATSEYVAILDDDAEVPPQWLATIREELRRFRQPDALFGEIRAPAAAADPKGLSVSTFLPEADRTWTSLVHPSRLGYGGHMVVRRKVFLELGGFDPRLGPGTPLFGAEDMDFNYRLLRSSKKAATSSAVWMTHHQWRRPEDLPGLMYGYNLGHSAFCVKHLLRGDLRPLGLLATQAIDDLKMLGSALRRRSRLRARVAIRRAAGTWYGVLEGWLTFRR